MCIHRYILSLCSIYILVVYHSLFVSVFLKRKDITTAKQLRNSSLKWARLSINIIGEKIIKELRGEKCFLIQYSNITKKTICTSRTFGEIVTDFEDLSSSIAMYATRCAEKLRLQNFKISSLIAQKEKISSWIAQKGNP